MDKIDKILDEYDARFAAAEEHRSQSKERDEEFEKRYQSAREEIIIPTMEEMKEKLEQRGHSVQISKYGETVFEFHAKGSDYSRISRGSTPHLTMSRNKDEIRTHLMEMKYGGGGRGGAGPSCAIEELDRDFVEDLIVRIVQYALS